MALKDLFSKLKKDTTTEAKNVKEAVTETAKNVKETVTATTQSVKEAVVEKAGTVKEAVDAGIAEAKKEIVTATQSGKSILDEFKAAGQKANEEAEAEKIAAVAKEVINGKYGNGDARKKALAEAGYDYATVQKRVNEILHSK